MSVTPNSATKTSESQPNKPDLDVYSVFQESLDNYFKEIRKNTSNYLQSISDLQEEIVESRRNNAKKAIELQELFCEKFDGKTAVPPSALSLAKSFAENASTSWTLQNKLVLDSLQTLSKNIEAFNKNSISFEEINKKLIDRWASIIKQVSKKQE